MRPRRGSLYALEETIASLHEELQFTLNYAQAMVRDRNYRAAAEVIEEQRRSLVVASKRIERAIAPEPPVRRQARVRATLVGVAAAMALASGAFAAFGPAQHAPGTRSKIQALEDASQALSAATEIPDPQTLQLIVSDANEKIMAVASLNSTDPAVKLSLLESVRRLQDVLQNPNVPQRVREQAERTVEDIVVDVEERATETESKSGTNPAPKPQTPNAEPSV
jgi:hypothetical protein